MSGLRGTNAYAYAPNKGQRRQSEPCDRCGTVVRFFERPRLMFCHDCWRTYWQARDSVINERAATAFPNHRADPAERREYRTAMARLRQNDRSIPDAEILVRMPPVLAMVGAR